jgi:hypothetical protein
MGQEGPKAPRRVRGRWGWRGRGHSDRQLPQREWAGEQRAAGVGGQVVAVVRGVEEHDQRAAVVLADLFTDRTPVLSGNVDDDHIGRRSTPGQLQRCLDHVDGAILTEQAEQLDTRPHTSIQQGHALRDLWCWHLSSLGGLATSGHKPKWSALLGRRAEHVAVVMTGTPWCRGWGAFVLASWRQARYHIKRFRLIRRYMGTSALPGPGRVDVLRHIDGRCLKVKVEHGRLLGRPAGH